MHVTYKLYKMITKKRSFINTTLTVRLTLVMALVAIVAAVNATTRELGNSSTSIMNTTTKKNSSSLNETSLLFLLLN